MYTFNLYSLKCADILSSTNSVCIKKWPQGDWINYSKLQVGVFGCQTSLSHTGEIVILAHELNMTEHRRRKTHTHTQVYAYTVCEYMFMLLSAHFLLCVCTHSQTHMKHTDAHFNGQTYKQTRLNTFSHCF